MKNSLRWEKGKYKLQKKGAQMVNAFVKITETFAHQGNANYNCT